jgi:septal ring factor EnvC (AmiA/AmiB activator)
VWALAETGSSSPPSGVNVVWVVLLSAALAGGLLKIVADWFRERRNAPARREQLSQLIQKETQEAARDMLAELRAEYARLRTELRDAEARIARLESELAAERRENGKLTQMLVEAGEQRARVEEQMRQLREEMAYLQRVADRRLRPNIPPP